MEQTSITTITTTPSDNEWIAKVVFYSPAKTEIEVKSNVEQTAYKKLKNYLGLHHEPTQVEELENGNIIYNF